MAEVVLDRLDKVYDNGFKAVSDLSLDIEDAEFLVLVGPSGCGKSTALRMVAGLEDITGGELRIGGRRMNETASRDRDIAMVFQSYALYPHMSVYDNIAFGLKLRKMDKSEIDKRVKRASTMLGLDDLLSRKPKQLSGGQRQRVAMGRAIVRQPKAFLMDEPLSNLDAKLRVSMRAELSALHARLGTTTIYVTHDQVEAMTLGQRVAVMRDGRIQQVDTPQGLYRSPKNLFVASFIGSPAMNLVEGRVENSHVELAGFRLPLADGTDLPDGRVIVGVRPEAFEDASFADPGLPAIDVEVAVTEELGSDTHVIFPVDAPPVDSETLLVAEQQEEELTLGGDRAVFNARVDARSPAEPGGALRLAVDPARFHFFDAETGANLALGAAERPQPAATTVR